MPADLSESALPLRLSHRFGTVADHGQRGHLWSQFWSHSPPSGAVRNRHGTPSTAGGNAPAFAGPPDEHLESVLGATPHEFESRILRSRLNRRNEGPSRNRGSALRRDGCSFDCTYVRHSGHIAKQAGARSATPGEKQAPTCTAEGVRNSAVDVAAVANGQGPHGQLTVLDHADGPVAVDPEPPTGTVPLEGL